MNLGKNVVFLSIPAAKITFLFLFHLFFFEIKLSDRLSKPIY